MVKRDAAYTFDHAGLTVHIMRDLSAENPRDARSGRHRSTTIACFWTPRPFGDEDWGRDFEPEVECEGCADSDEGCGACDYCAYRTVSLSEYVEQTHGALASTLLRYDDYGVRGSRIYAYVGDDPNRAGVNGIMYVTPAQWAEAHGVPHNAADAEHRAWAQALMQGELDEYDHYLSGDTYGFVVEQDGEHLSSCWGFICAYNDDYLLGQAREAAEDAASKLAAEADERAAMAARGIVTVER